MRTVVLAATLLVPLTAAHADESSWILQPDLTPAGLTERGAVLTASDSVRWPNGPSVDLSYWLGDGDVVYRCAELAAETATNASCWRLEVVAADQSRVISTRQRPAPTVEASQPLAVQPYLYWNGMPPVAERPSHPSRPHPTPLPTPAP
jgi:hypothetical protein